MSGPLLVTGATGFAGSHLVDHLLECTSDRVAAWGHSGGRTLPPPHDSRVAWSSVDLLNRDELAQAVGELGPSAVFHCAGFADVHAASLNSASALRVNAVGTEHLVEAVRGSRLDAPVLVVSSGLVYRPSNEPVDEESPIGPANAYGVSKLAQEMSALRAPGARIFLARPFNHAGPRQSDAYVTSSFARQIAEAEAGLREPVLRVGNLDSMRDITDVRDTVRAYRLLMERGQPKQPYNVCRGEAYRIGDLMERLVRQSRVAIRVETDSTRLRPSDNPVVLGSAERLHRDTGWEPRIPIDRTLADLLEYWRDALKPEGSTP